MPPATRIDALIDALVAARAERRWTKRQVAKAAGIHPNSLRTFGLRDKDGRHVWLPGYAVLRRVERALLPPPAPPCEPPCEA